MCRGASHGGQWQCIPNHQPADFAPQNQHVIIIAMSALHGSGFRFSEAVRGAEAHASEPAAALSLHPLSPRGRMVRLQWAGPWLCTTAALAAAAGMQHASEAFLVCWCSGNRLRQHLDV